jgi:O-antigen/teichoic acid export membrane protein
VILRDYWAVLYAMVISGLVRVAISYLAFPDSRAKLSYNAAYGKDVFAFARIVVGSSIITLVITQADRIILSKAFSVGEFGLYVLALNIAAMPPALAVSYASKVLYPRYSEFWRTSRDVAIARLYSERSRFALAYAALAGALLGLAPHIIAILYDPRYTDAANYLRIMAVPAVFALNNQADTHFLIAAGRVGAHLKVNVVRLCWLFATAPAGLMLYGPTGLIWSFALVECPAMFYNWCELRKLGCLSIRGELIPLMCAAAVCVFAMLASQLVRPAFG